MTRVEVEFSMFGIAMEGDVMLGVFEDLGDAITHIQDCIDERIREGWEENQHKKHVFRLFINPRSSGGKANATE